MQVNPVGLMGLFAPTPLEWHLADLTPSDSYTGGNPVSCRRPLTQVP